MYRNKVKTSNPYRKNTLLESSLSIKPKQQHGSKFDLLWRKKSSKVHKTWEGDALGILTRTSEGHEMIVKHDGFIIAKFKLDPEKPLCEGRILTSGSFEFEMGAQHILNPKKAIVAENTKATLVSHRSDSASNPNMSLSDNSSSLSAFRRNSLPSPKGVISSSHTKNPKNNLRNAIASSGETESSSSGTSTFQITSSIPQKRASGTAFPFRIPLVKQKESSIKTSGDMDPTLKSKLRPHQCQAVQFMRESVLGVKHGHGYGCILADEMGLGKTLTAIALVHTLLRHKNIHNALIACPVSLIANWKNEFSKWLPSNEHIVPTLGIMTIDQNGLGNGSLKDPVRSFFSDRNFRTHQVMIVGYERMRLLSTKMAAKGKTFDLVICDEGHRLKSPGSKTTEALSEISGDKRVILTGTPIQNELSEFRALADFVNPGCLGSESYFENKYANPIRNYATFRQENRIKSEDDSSDLDDVVEFLSSQNEESQNSGAVAAQEALSQLSEICDEFMLRRTSSVIENYLAVPRTEAVVFCRPTKAQVSKYQSLVDQADELVKVDQFVNQGACLKALSELKKAAAGDAQCQGGKLKFLASLLDAINCHTDYEKVVVASGSTRVLDLCQQLCANKKYAWLRLDGSTPQQKRQSRVSIFNKFSRKQAFVFLLSTRSGGTGLNLIGASRLVLMDCDWNPAVDAQVMARIHRDGQTRACFIYRLLTTGTIDEKIFQRQLSKLGLSENVLLGFAGTTRAEFSLDTLRDLFTFSRPPKCNTLESSAQEKGGLKRYEEDEEGCLSDTCLQLASSEAKNVSCILRRKRHIQLID